MDSITATMENGRYGVTLTEDNDGMASIMSQMSFLSYSDSGSRVNIASSRRMQEWLGRGAAVFLCRQKGTSSISGSPPHGRLSSF